MASHLNKIVNEIVVQLKKHPVPGMKNKSLWDMMTAQLSEAGVWDDDQIELIRKEIDEQLKKFKKNDLIFMWKETETGTENYIDDASIKLKTVKEDLGEEFLNRVMDKMGEKFATENEFSKNVYYKEEEEKYDEDSLLNLDDDDDFSEDNFIDDADKH